MVSLVIEGQTLDIPESIAINDDALRKAIAPLFPQVASARFERVTDPEGRTVIKVTKEAGTKGLTAEAIADALTHCPRHLNPAISLAQDLQQALNRAPFEDVLAMERTLDTAIQQGEHELQVTHAILTRLQHAPAVPASTTPIGF